MRSTFSGFNSAVSGLFAAQRALDVIGHNIANQATPGYTRQKALQHTADPVSIENGKWLGTGVTMGNIIQIRDEILDLKYRNQFNQQGYWEEVQLALGQIETIFEEPVGNGLTVLMNNFFQSINTVIKNPEDPTTRATFLTNARALTDSLNSKVIEFEKMIEDVDDDINATVVQVNTLSKQIADLNKIIVEAESQGGNANDLRDKRNLLIDEISELIDVRVEKTIHEDVKTGKKVEKLLLIAKEGTLVDHDEYNELEVDTGNIHPLFKSSREQNVPKSDDLKSVRVTEVKMKGSLKKLDMNKTGGKLGAMIQMRDSYGDPTDDCPAKGIPYYVRMINEFAKAFANKINEVHKKGFDSKGNQGEDFFVISGNSDQINARNITVNSNLVRNPDKLAVGTNKDESNQYNFMELYDVRNFNLKLEIIQNKNGEEVTLNLATGNPEDVIKSQISAVLGVESNEAKVQFNSQTIKTLEIDMMRMSVSGVSENEELVNMVKFQHAYNAAARMITTVDEMLDVIINRMGRVGL